MYIASFYLSQEENRAWEVIDGMPVSPPRPVSITTVSYVSQSDANAKSAACEKAIRARLTSPPTEQMTHSAP